MDGQAAEGLGNVLLLNLGAHAAEDHHRQQEAQANSHRGHQSLQQAVTLGHIVQGDTQNGTYPLNGGTNTLVIENGAAWLSHANCPDELCVKQGKISHNGQVITCLPNKLTVTVYGAAQNDVDLVS